MGNTSHCKWIREEYANLGDFMSYASVCTVFYLIYGFIFLFGVLGNGGIIYSVFTDGRNSRLYVTKVFLFNMAASGILLCVVSVTITPIYNCEKNWLFGENAFLCQFFPISQVLSVIVSSFSLILIAIDRFRNIVTMSSPWSGKEALILSAICWSLAIGFSLPVGMSHIITKYPGYCGVVCSDLSPPGSMKYKIYGSVLFVVQYLIPLASMAYCYIRIIRKVRRDMLVTTEDLRITGDAARKRRHVLVTLCTLVCSFTLAWFPLAVNNILLDFGIQLTGIKHSLFVQMICHMLGVSTVVCNPFLYYWINKSVHFDRETRARRSLVNTLSVRLLEAPGISNPHHHTPTVCFPMKQRKQRQKRSVSFSHGSGASLLDTNLGLHSALQNSGRAGEND